MEIILVINSTYFDCMLLNENTGVSKKDKTEPKDEVEIKDEVKTLNEIEEHRKLVSAFIVFQKQIN